MSRTERIATENKRIDESYINSGFFDKSSGAKATDVDLEKSEMLTVETQETYNGLN